MEVRKLSKADSVTFEITLYDTYYRKIDISKLDVFDIKFYTSYPEQYIHYNKDFITNGEINIYAADLQKLADGILKYKCFVKSGRLFKAENWKEQVAGATDILLLTGDISDFAVYAIALNKANGELLSAVPEGNSGSGGSISIDNKTIVMNDSDEIKVNDYVLTASEYNGLATKDPDATYYIINN
jgi:hypothetical protein